MKKRKILLVIILLILTIGIALLIYMKIQGKDLLAVETEITPLEEITEEQERQTMISLYFVNVETNTLVPEARRIDAKKLVENPYKTLVEFLIEKPRNEKLVSCIPEGTKVNNAVLKNNTIEIDLSKEFIENQKGGIEKAKLSIYSIVNTLTELNEVNAVKLLIEGKEVEKFKDLDLNLKDNFTRNS